MSLAALIRSIRARLVAPAHVEEAGPRQIGAIPYTIVGGKACYLMVTSRRTGRWIFPKGSVISGMTPWDSAAQEAFEEAGVRGVVETEPLGSYSTLKIREMRRRRLAVDLYPLRITDQLQEWPEAHQRHRHWVLLPEARRLLSDPQLVEIVERLDKRENGRAHQADKTVSTA